VGTELLNRMSGNFMNRQKSRGILAGITRNVIVLGLVSLLTDLSSQMVFPLIPLFLVSVLGAGAYAVGIVEGAAETTASLLKVFSGYWSDRIRKRRPFVLFGYSLSSITKPLFALAHVWPMVLFIRILERVGKGLRTAPRDAIVAESCDECVRGKAFGFHRTMDGIGSVLGAIFAFLLLPVLGYRKIFFLGFVPAIIGALVVLFVNEGKQSSATEVERVKLKLSIRALPVNLRLFIAVATVFSLGHFGYAFLLLRSKGIGFTDQNAILLYVLFYVVYALCSVPSGMLSDRIGRKPILMVGYGIFALCALGLVFISSRHSIFIFFAVYGLSYAMFDGAQRAFVVDLAPAHLKGTALGTFHTAIGLVALPGGFIAGLLWDKIEPLATFLYGFTLTLIAVILFAFVKKE
jgi:MFS family permease